MPDDNGGNTDDGQNSEPDEGTPPEGGNPDELPAWARAELKKVRTEAATHRVKLRELEPLAKAHREAEDAKKSETERLTSAFNSEKSRADAAELNLMRLQVGLDKGLTAAQARRLSGKTHEELEADADELLEAFGAKKASDEGEPRRTGPSGRPRERLRGGGDPDDEPEETDPRKLAAKIPRT